jgi:hypothetical protein
MVIAQPGQSNYPDFFSQIENGTIKIPQFQRNFVWSRSKAAALLDSVVKGYPVGTFIFWHTNERLRTVRSIGNGKFKDKPRGEYLDYVIDGQQRLTSLYAAINGSTVVRANGRTDDFSQIFIDLDADEHEDIVTTSQSDVDRSYIALSELLGGQFLTLLQDYDESYYPKLQHYMTALKTYNFPVVFVKDAEIDLATEIFTRINVSGQALTPFQILVAKTYDERRGFDLSEAFASLSAKLAELSFDIGQMTPLQLIALIRTRDCRRQNVLKLEKTTVINLWDPVRSAIEDAIDHLRQVQGVKVSELLPYGGLSYLSPISITRMAARSRRVLKTSC